MYRRSKFVVTLKKVEQDSARGGLGVVFGTFDCLYSQTRIVYSPYCGCMAGFGGERGGWESSIVHNAVAWLVGSSECCY